VQPPPVSVPDKVPCRLGREARGVAAQLLEGAAEPGPRWRARRSAGGRGGRADRA
jgi:hypothetical protein